jgi:hypothetical protein
MAGTALLEQAQNRVRPEIDLATRPRKRTRCRASMEVGSFGGKC